MNFGIYSTLSLWCFWATFMSPFRSQTRCLTDLHQVSCTFIPWCINAWILTEGAPNFFPWGAQTETKWQAGKMQNGRWILRVCTAFYLTKADVYDIYCFLKVASTWGAIWNLFRGLIWCCGHTLCSLALQVETKVSLTCVEQKAEMKICTFHNGLNAMWFQTIITRQLKMYLASWLTSVQALLFLITHLTSR